MTYEDELPPVRRGRRYGLSRQFGHPPFLPTQTLPTAVYADQNAVRLAGGTSFELGDAQK
jgi:hypothetical protein